MRGRETLNVLEEGVDKQAVKSSIGDLRSEIAEGHALLRAEMKGSIGELRSEVGEFRSEFDTFRSDVGQDFSDVRSMIKLSYADIDTRISTLERELGELKARVEGVEAAIR